MTALEFVAIDVEATGLDPSRSEIIEFAALRFTLNDEDVLVQSFVQPFGPIPLEIERLTTISNDDVMHAPRLLDLEPIIRRTIGRRTVVGHNIDYDMSMLAGGGIALENDVIDTLSLSRLLLPGLPSYSLENLATRLGLTGDGTAHRAGHDVAVTVRLMRLLVAQVGRIDAATRTRIAGLLSASDFRLADLLLNADIPVIDEETEAQRSPEIRFLSTRKRPEPLRPNGTSEPIDLDRVTGLFAEEGLLSQSIEDFQHRPGQEAMAVAVTRAFNRDQTLIVEAGTGTGKSMAYLAPAAFHALQRGERVVVSTNTIALQDQLYSKDVPALRSAIAATGSTEPITATVMKGRSNYICLKRWFNHQRTMSAGVADSSMRGRVMIWLRTTESGDRAELNLNNDEDQAFRNVSAEGDACVASRCAYNHRNQCFLFRARREAEASHLVIVNHALLLSDALAENSILPESQFLVIDEAHHLEEQATKQFGFSISDGSLTKVVEEVHRQDGPISTGVTTLAADLLARTWRNQSKISEKTVDALIKQVKEGSEHILSVRRSIDDFFGHVTGLLSGLSSHERNLRITPMVREEHAWVELELLGDNLSGELRKLDRDLRWFHDQIEKLDKVEEGSEEDDDRSDLMLQIDNARRDLVEQRGFLNEIVLNPDEGGIYWIERSFNQRVSLHAAPLHVGSMLQERLFERQRSVVLTSATISTDGSFGFVKERLGLDKTKELATPAPFDYRRRAMVYVTDDLPEPNQPGYQRALEDAILSLAKGARGRTLVLFTSHASLQQTYNGVKPRLEREGIALLAQRIDGSPRRLIERMRLGGPMVVFGAATFWEGVDIAGPALSAIAIVRLPFSVPTDPIVAARSELFDNPFMEYSVPQAILKFKQGFGRLIRRHEDVGICAVLDRRVVSKRYGRSFLESLPDCTVKIGSAQFLEEAADAWLSMSDQRDVR